jgi:hypothetical protein
MNPRQFATVAPALCGTIVLAGWVVASLDGLGSASIENASAVPKIAEHHAPVIADNTELPPPPQATALGSVAVASADVAAAVEAVKGIVTDTAPPSDQPEPILQAALPDPSETVEPDAAPTPEATANTPDPVPSDTKETTSRIEILDECWVVDICVDRYLWALYQRTPKEDTNKVSERRKVTVKNRGKMVTVTRTFTRLVDADFTW